VAAALISEKVAGAISAGDHGTTYGGNLLPCRAALFFLEQLMDRAARARRDAGAHFERQLRTLALRHPVIEEVRGSGLMWGLQLKVDAAPIIDGARERGLIVNRTHETVVRMLPPLNIDKADLDRAVEILDEVFAAVPAEVKA
jgi:acetylornithine/N-succinyldiaminopimelate aminotransferase